MATVLIHAGMAKTGSTSIQEWLKLRVHELRESHSITVLQEVPASDATSYGFKPLASGFHVYANLFLVSYAASYACSDVPEMTRLADEFAHALDLAAAQFGTVLVTSEGFAALFQRGERPFLDALERLARRHEVRVAFYVRPQNTALEARWREWGFRTGLAPSDWVVNECRDLCYWETSQLVASTAPSVGFEVRPFRKDLLASGDVVHDFATQFLGLADPPDTSERDENPGIPLELVNLLRSGPPELLEHGTARRGWRQGALGPIVRRWQVEESAQTRASHDLLRRYAYSVFEAANQRLLHERGWATDTFVAGPAPDPACPPELHILDQLWDPTTTDAARAYLFAAINEIWELVDAIDTSGEGER